jgi:hypothetical protein
VRESFPAGCSGARCMGMGCPRRAGGHQSWRRWRRWCSGARGKWRAKEIVNWEEKEPVKVMSQKRGGEGACTGGCCDGEVADGRAAGQRGTRAREPGSRG